MEILELYCEVCEDERDFELDKVYDNYESWECSECGYGKLTRR